MGEGQAHQTEEYREEVREIVTETRHIDSRIGNIVQNLLIRLLLWRRKEGFCNIIVLNGKTYLVSIRKHEPATEFIDRMEEALREQGQGVAT